MLNTRAPIPDEVPSDEDSNDMANHPCIETPDGGNTQGVEVSTQTDQRGTNSPNLSPEEKAEFSAFVEEANLLGSRFLSWLNKEKSITVRRNEDYHEHLVQLLNFIVRQHAWICLLHGKASGEEGHQLLAAI